MRITGTRVRLTGLLQAAAVLATLFSLATLDNQAHRVLELFSHFRLQYLVGSTVLAVFFIVLRSRPWAVSMLAVTLVNAWTVTPWYFGDAVTASESRIEVLHANVLSSNKYPNQLIDLIARMEPDIVFLQEVTGRWNVELETLRSLYPHGHVVVREDNFGIAVLARQPIMSVEAIATPPFGFPTLVVRQAFDDQIVTFVSTHPLPPIGASGFADRNEQLASTAETVSTITGPTVVIGDLNSSMWAHHYKEFIQLTGLVNARHGFGVLPTWPVHLPFAMIPIDHCLVSAEIAVVDIAAGPDIGSDHLPLLVTLAIKE